MNCPAQSRRPQSRHPQTRAPRRRDRGGAVVVEFAILAPILFLLIFGMIEYGRMVMVQQIITNAAREGAREGILDGATDQSIRDAVTSKAQSAIPQLTDSDILIDRDDNDPANPPDDWDTMTVTVGIGFDQVSWLPGALWLGGRRMQASSSMRRETVQ